MKEIVVLSGKGGTGKTSMVGCFASIAGNKVLVDCDVDAADLDLLLQLEFQKKEEFWSGQTAVIDKGKCSQCGLCQEICRFEAITDYVVDAVSCEGCAFCHYICPEEAITMKDNMAGHWFISNTRYGPLCHAKLGIAQESSGKLVAIVRQNARLIAENDGLEYIITDGPPGIGCPVISSLSGADLALIVTEPTLSGMHDLNRIIGVCNHFGVTSVVCISKCDLNEDNVRQIEDYCNNQQIEIISKIPFDKAVTEALVRGVPVVEYSDGEISRQIKLMWQSICQML